MAENTNFIPPPSKKTTSSKAQGPSGHCGTFKSMQRIRNTVFNDPVRLYSKTTSSHNPWSKQENILNKEEVL